MHIYMVLALLVVLGLYAVAMLGAYNESRNHQDEHRGYRRIEGRTRDPTLPPCQRKPAIKRKERQYNDMNNGDVYFYITDIVTIQEATWTDSAQDYLRCDSGNCFPTMHEAAAWQERLIVLSILGFYSDVDSLTDEGWCLAYDTSTGQIIPSLDMGTTRAVLPFTRFSTYEKAQQAVENIGPERLKQFYFGITED